MYQKKEAAIFLFNGMNQPEMFTTFPALDTFERQVLDPPLVERQDHEDQFESDQDDDNPFEEVGVLDAHVIREH